MPSHAIHNPAYRGTSHVGNAPLKKGEQKDAFDKIKSVHFSRVDLYGPTKNMNPKHRAKVIAARKAMGLI